MRDDPQLRIRLPEEVKAFIVREAQVNACSLNSEVVRSIRERMERTSNDDGAKSLAAEPRRHPHADPVTGGQFPSKLLEQPR